MRWYRVDEENKLRRLHRDRGLSRTDSEVRRVVQRLAAAFGMPDASPMPYCPSVSSPLGTAYACISD